jgi:hypothetical protein
MKLNSIQYQRVGQELKALHEVSSDIQQSAKDRLHKMAIEMVGKNGSIKYGYIRLVNDGDNALRLGTRWSKKADHGTKDALSYVRDLVTQAYGEDSPAMAALEKYVQAKPDHIGTHSFVKLVRSLEAVNPEGGSRVDRLLKARVKDDAKMETEAIVASHTQERMIAALPEPLLAQPHHAVQAAEDDHALAEQAAQEVEPERPPEQEVSVEIQSLSPAIANEAVAQQLADAPLPLLTLAPYLELTAAAASYQVPSAERPETPIERALAHMTEGNHDLALAELCSGNNRPSAADLAKLVVDQHLKGIPLPAQLAKFALAMEKQGSFSEADLAEFAFEAVKLPHGDAAAAADFDATRLDGLVGFGQLWRALHSNQNLSMITRLAKRLDQELDASSSCQALSTTLRLIADTPALSLTDMISKHKNLDKEREASLEALDDADLDAADKSRQQKMINDEYTQSAKDLLDGLRRQINALIDSGLPIFISQDKAIKDKDLRYAHTLAKVVTETAAQRNVNLSGLHQPRTVIKTAINHSLLENFNLDGGVVNVNAQNSIINFEVFSKNTILKKSDLSGSDITLQLMGYDVSWTSFSGVNLKDAHIRFDFSSVSERLNRVTKEARPRVLADLFNHLNLSYQRGPLETIAKIDDTYPDTKIHLMKQMLEFVNRHGGLAGLEVAFVDVLSRSPVYFKDARIRELIAPMHTALRKKLQNTDPQQSLPVLLGMLEPALGERSPAVHTFIRKNITDINTLLWMIENNPQGIPIETLQIAERLRENLNSLPEIQPIATMLNSLYLEYERPDGKTVEMPYYFEFNQEGAIAAMDVTQFVKVSNSAPNAKFIDDTMFFVPPHLRYGQEGQEFHRVGDTDHVLLATGHIKNQGPALLQSFPLLGRAYKEGQPSPALTVTNLLFEGDPTLHGWVSDAYKGVGRRLTENDITYLQNKFALSASNLFTGFENANNPAHWPQSGLTPQFEQSLRELAHTQGVSTDNDKRFAHFLFSQSAALTRLSSEKIFGDGDNSIPPLRFAGYTLFSRARQLAPDLLPQEVWQDMENRYLQLNNAMDCAEIISRIQFQQSNRANPDEFERFTPAVFKSLA